MRFATKIHPTVATGAVAAVALLLNSSRFNIAGTRFTAAAMSSSSSATKPGNEGKAALIFLHGLGDTPAGWSSLEYSLPSIKPRLSQLRYIFPPAPIIPISINGGMEMPGWFDLYDWPIGVGIKDDKDGLVRSVKQIEEIVEKLDKEDGIDRSRIIVGGFSQGGAIALLTAYRNLVPTAENKEQPPPPYAACVALSAWLTLSSDEKIESKGTETPLFWAHGSYDDKVLFEQQAFGVDKLQKQGVAVQSSSYPMGHSSHPDEMIAMADFIDKTLYGENDNDKEL